MGKVDDSCNRVNTEIIDKITDKVKLNLSWEGMFSFSSRVIKSWRVVKQKPAYSDIIKEMKVHSRFVLVLPHSSIIPYWNPMLLNASILFMVAFVLSDLRLVSCVGSDLRLVAIVKICKFLFAEIILPLFQFENMRKVDEFSKSLKLNTESIGKETTDKVRPTKI
jgi:hypothetical protein